MTVTREQWDKAMTYEAYKAQMTRNREQLEANELSLALTPDDIDGFRALPQPLNVLVLAEDWCGDVIANLPVLGRLARESGRLQVRVLLRDQNLELMNQYLKDGQFQSIPVCIFLDDELREIGVFTERPDSVTALRNQKRADLYRQHPGWGSPSEPIAALAEETRLQVMQATAAMREETRAFANAEVVREFQRIAQRNPAATHR